MPSHPALDSDSRLAWNSVCDSMQTDRGLVVGGTTAGTHPNGLDRLFEWARPPRDYSFAAMTLAEPRDDDYARAWSNLIRQMAAGRSTIDRHLAEIETEIGRRIREEQDRPPPESSLTPR